MLLGLFLGVRRKQKSLNANKRGEGGDGTVVLMLYRWCCGDDGAVVVMLKFCSGDAVVLMIW